MKLERHQLLRATLIAAVAAIACAGISTASVILERTLVLNALDVQAWRPAFMVWSAGFLVAGWVLNHHSQKNRPPEAAADASPNGSRKSIGIILWIATGALLLALTFPSLSSAVSSALEPKWPATVSPNAIITAITLPSMDCDSCIRSIDGILRRQRGIEKAQFNIQNRQAEVWYNPDKTQQSSIIESLRSHGYEVSDP